VALLFNAAKKKKLVYFLPSLSLSSNLRAQGLHARGKKEKKKTYGSLAKVLLGLLVRHFYGGFFFR
jgi:hypothetical protein